MSINRHRTRETGFPEPLSKERNTTLPYGDAQTAPHEELDTTILADRPQQQRAERAQEEMYSGLEIQDNADDEEQKDGVVKKVLNKVTCGTV